MKSGKSTPPAHVIGSCKVSHFHMLLSQSLLAYPYPNHSPYSRLILSLPLMSSFLIQSHGLGAWISRFHPWEKNLAPRCHVHTVDRVRHHGPGVMYIPPTVCVITAQCYVNTADPLHPADFVRHHGPGIMYPPRTLSILPTAGAVISTSIEQKCVLISHIMHPALLMSINVMHVIMALFGFIH